MCPATNKTAYKRHKYSGPRKSLKRVRGGLRRHHEHASRLKVWRSEGTKKPVNEEILIENSVIQSTQARTYARAKPKPRLKATYDIPSTSDTPSTNNTPSISPVTTQQLDWEDQAAVKRALDETSTPRGEHKRPRLNQSKRAPQRSYTQAASATLDVAITCKRTGILSREVSDQVLAAIQRQIILEACSPKLDIPGPTFNAKPLVAGGAVKLWCGNDHTLAWLKKTVSDISVPTNISLVVKSQSEVQKRTRCGIVIPDEQGVYGESTNIGCALSYQNPWIDIKRWVLLFANKQAEKWFVVVGVPVDQIPALMEAGRRLSIGLGAVYVKFQGRNGRFTGAPQGWDPATGTIGEVPNQPRTPVGESSPITDNLEASATEPTLAGSTAPAAAAPSSGAELDGFDEGDLFPGFRLEGLASNGVPFVGL